MKSNWKDLATLGFEYYAKPHRQPVLWWGSTNMVSQSPEHTRGRKHWDKIANTDLKNDTVSDESYFTTDSAICH